MTSRPMTVHPASLTESWIRLAVNEEVIMSISLRPDDGGSGGGTGG
jgi:hypothetical protein